MEENQSKEPNESEKGDSRRKYANTWRLVDSFKENTSVYAVHKHRQKEFENPFGVDLQSLPTAKTSAKIATNLVSLKRKKGYCLLKGKEEDGNYKK